VAKLELNGLINLLFSSCEYDDVQDDYFSEDNAESIESD